MARQNYGFEKRQKEIAKQKKRDEKRRKKEEKNRPPADQNPNQPQEERPEE